MVRWSPGPEVGDEVGVKEMCSKADWAIRPWLVLSVLEASVLSARTLLLSAVGFIVVKAREGWNAFTTLLFWLSNAVVSACSGTLSAS